MCSDYQSGGVNAVRDKSLKKVGVNIETGRSKIPYTISRVLWVCIVGGQHEYRNITSPNSIFTYLLKLFFLGIGPL